MSQLASTQAPQTGDNTSMRAPADLVRMMGVVANFNGQTLAEYLNATFREKIVSDYRDTLAAMSASVPE